MGSTVTQKKEIPDPTPEELALMELATDGLMTAQLEQSGYEVTKKSGTWEESSDYQAFQSKKQKVQSQIDVLESKLNTGTQIQRNEAWQQLAPLKGKLADLEEDEINARKEFKPEIEYDIRQKADLQTEAIRREVENKYKNEGYFGEELKAKVESDPRYKEAFGAYEQKRMDREKQQGEIDQQILDRTQKFLAGDFALNDNQKKFMEESLGPIREAGLKAIQTIKDEAANTDKSISQAIGDFEKRVKETGMNMGDAIVALEERVKKTGVDMNKALDEEINTTKKLVEMGITDYTKAQRARIAQQAAALGRASDDPEFQMELQELATREIERAGLEFGRYASEKKVGIAERTGAGLESAAQLRLGLAERTGGQLESAAQQRIGLAERTGGLREDAARMEGQLGLGLAENSANLRSSLAMGMVPQQIGTGLNVSQYQNAIMQQRLANTQAALQTPLSIYSIRAQERFAEPTTTTTQSGGIGDIFGGILGAGVGAAQAYSGISTAGAYNTMAQKYTGGARPF